MGVKGSTGALGKALAAMSWRSEHAHSIKFQGKGQFRQIIGPCIYPAYSALFIQVVATSPGAGDSVKGALFGHWQQKPSCSPPSPSKTGELVYGLCYDDWPMYEEHNITVNLADYVGVKTIGTKYIWPFFA